MFYIDDSTTVIDVAPPLTVAGDRLSIQTQADGWLRCVAARGEFEVAVVRPPTADLGECVLDAWTTLEVMMTSRAKIV